MKKVEIRAQLKSDKGILTTNADITKAARELGFGDKAEYNQEQAQSIISKLSGEPVPQPEQLKQESPDVAEAGALSVLARATAPLARLDDAFDAVEDAWADKIAHRVRRLNSNIMQRVSHKLQAEESDQSVVEMTFTALFPSPSVVKLNPAKPESGANLLAV